MADQSSVDISGFRDVIKQLNEETNRSLPNSVRYGYIQFVTSMGAASKPSKPTRGHEKFKPTDKSRAWYKSRDLKPPNKAIVVLRQNGHKKLIPFSGPKLQHPRARIANRGLAKRSWGVAKGKIAGGGSLSGKRTRTNPAKSVSVTNRLSNKAHPTISVRNTLPYLNKAYPGQVNIALGKATNRIRKQIELGIARQAAKHR